MTAMYRHAVLKGAQGKVRAHIPVARGESLFDAIERSGQKVKTRCRASMICGQCWVRVEEGADVLPPATDGEKELLQKNAPGQAMARLACQVVLPDDAMRLVVSTDYW